MVHINDNRKIKLTCTIDQVSLKQWPLKTKTIDSTQVSLANSGEKILYIP